MKHNIVFSIIIVVIAFLIVSKCSYDNNQKARIYKGNQSEIIDGVHVDSVNHVTEPISVVSTSNKETKELLGEQGKKALERIDVRPSKVEKVTELITQTRYDTIVKVDTIYRHDTIVQTFRVVDDYINFGGYIENGELQFDLQMRDSITIVAHRKKKKFLFIPYYSRKKIETELINNNPYSLIIYAKEVEVIK